jgi:hypothetical protein
MLTLMYGEMKNNLESLQSTYLTISFEQVDVETKLFPLLDRMKLTCSYYDYLEMQEEFHFLEMLFRRNEERLELLKKQIKELEGRITS